MKTLLLTTETIWARGMAAAAHDAGATFIDVRPAPYPTMGEDGVRLIIIDTATVPLEYISPTTSAVWVAYDRRLPDEQLVQLVHLGVHGILPYTMTADEITIALRAVMDGGRHFPARIVGLLAGPILHLSPREASVMSCMAEGLPNKEIAYRLGITVGTMKVYNSRLMDKVGVRSRLELALMAQRNGMTGVKPLDTIVQTAATPKAV